MLDKLEIHGAKFMCNLGVTADERGEKQEITVHVDFYTDIRKATASDDLADAVDYVAVYSTLKKVIEKQSYKLIETLGSRLADAVLHTFPISKVNVRIEKPSVLTDKNVDYAAIEVTREKQ
jgi:7,8-dihydroneopterin aldolase/epimerase/oxygenase